MWIAEIPSQPPLLQTNPAQLPQSFLVRDAPVPKSSLCPLQDPLQQLLVLLEEKDIFFQNES